MNILVLPGISQKTEKWAADLLTEMAVPDSTATIQRYSHWQCADDQCLRLEEEIERLQGCAVDLLIGKSLGVMIGLLACQRGIITPRQAIFIGAPVTSFREKSLDLRQLASDLNIPALYIQQKDDIVGSAASLLEQISAAAMAKIIEIPGNNHQYKDLKSLARFIRKWLGSA
jgi:hypothetical protein